MLSILDKALSTTVSQSRHLKQNWLWKTSQLTLNLPWIFMSQMEHQSYLPAAFQNVLFLGYWLASQLDHFSAVPSAVRSSVPNDWIYLWKNNIHKDLFFFSTIFLLHIPLIWKHNNMNSYRIFFAILICSPMILILKWLWMTVGAI